MTEAEYDLFDDYASGMFSLRRIRLRRKQRLERERIEREKRTRIPTKNDLSGFQNDDDWAIKKSSVDRNIKYFIYGGIIVLGIGITFLISKKNKSSLTTQK